jgi:outer membrane protein assembly factor BamA
VAVVVPIVRGPLVRFARIEVVGAKRIPVARVERELGIRAGSPFSETALDRGAARLRALGCFERVDVAVLPLSTDRDVVSVEVVER